MSDSTYRIDSNGTVVANFAVLERKARRMSDEALRWSIKDAREAADIAEFPGMNNPKAGYYRDEVHVYAQELGQRAKRAAWAEVTKGAA